MLFTGCRSLSDDEFDRILAAVEGRHRLRDRLYLIMAVRTGYRCHELLSMKCGSVFDYARSEARKEVTVAAVAMKGGKIARTMPLHPAAQKAILEYMIATRRTHHLYKETALFARQGGTGAITERQALNVVVDAAAAAGVDLDRVGTHSLRKTFAGRMWKHPAVAGDPFKLARILGHKDLHNLLTYVQACSGSELEQAVVTAA